MKTKPEHRAQPLRHLLAMRWVALGAAACAASWGLSSCGGSGGVDTGGTGQPTISSVVVGPITGFGSVVVGGVKFDDRAATVEDDDGAVLTAANLQLGMTTTVQGGAITAVAAAASAAATTSTDTATAYRILVNDHLLGPVTAVNTTTCTATVLGQKVVAVAATVVDSSLPATTAACRLAGLRANQAGQALLVYGAWDAAQARVVASRLELRTSVARYVLRGVVDSYNLAERKLTLGGQLISLADVPVAQLPAALAVGSFARVRLATAQVSSRWPALSLQGGEPALPAGVAATIEGRVSQLTTAQQFSVNGQVVDARSAVFSPNATGLVLGAKVEVKGTVTGSTMVASKVEIDTEQNDDSDAEIEIEGTISALNTAAKTFVVRGTTVSFAANPRYDSSTEADLADRRKVSVKGVLSADGRVLVATKIHVEL